MNPVYSILGYEVRLKWWETHHGYYGMVLMLYGAYLMIWGDFWAKIAGVFIFAFGEWLFLDDTDQHHRQVDNPGYHSPIHKWYVDNLYGFGFIKVLNELVDWFFGLPRIVQLISVVGIVFLIL